MIPTKRLGRLALASACVLAAAPALAHPGHGRDGGSHEPEHYLAEPEHLGAIGLTAVAGVAAAAFVLRARRKA